MRLYLGRRIAPPRFIAFAGIFIAGCLILPPGIGGSHGIMVAFDVAAAAFLLSLVPLFRQDEAAQMRARSNDNDANRGVLLAIMVAVLGVVLVTVGSEITQAGSKVSIALVILTLSLAWLYANVVYALHYAHLFYSDDQCGGDKRGLDIPNTAEPDYWDFIYFSFTLGMTFQTSDVQITDGTMRRVVVGHTLAAFVFNLGVLAFTVNVLGGSGH